MPASELRKVFSIKIRSFLALFWMVLQGNKTGGTGREGVREGGGKMVQELCGGPLLDRTDNLACSGQEHENLNQSSKARIYSSISPSS